MFVNINYHTLFNFVAKLLQSSYSIQNKFDLTVAKDESERVDTLRYTWNLVLNQAIEHQHHLGAIQPNFRGELITNIAQFQEDCKVFFDDYSEVDSLLVLLMFFTCVN